MAPTHAALLRGINVGASTRVPMADLRAVAAELGLADVATVLNSGNLLFSAGNRSEAGMPGIARDLEQAIAAIVGFAPPVLVRRVDEMADVAEAARRAFPAAERKSLAGIFLSAPSTVDIDAAFADFPEDLRRAPGDALVAHYVNGQAASKLGAPRIERILGVDIATVRGINTIEKLVGYTNH